jgi:hypothetical protein
VGAQGTVVVEAPPSWRALASLNNFLEVIDACRYVLANFEGKLYTVVTVCVSVLFLNMPVATAMHSYVIRLKTSNFFCLVGVPNWWGSLGLCPCGPCLNPGLTNFNTFAASASKPVIGSWHDFCVTVYTELSTALA